MEKTIGYKIAKITGILAGLVMMGLGAFMTITKNVIYLSWIFAGGAVLYLTIIER